MFHGLIHCIPSVPTASASSLLINIKDLCPAHQIYAELWAYNFHLTPNFFSIGYFFPQFKMCFQSLSLGSSACFESKWASGTGVGEEPSHISGTKLPHDSHVYSSFLFSVNRFRMSSVLNDTDLFLVCFRLAAGAS